MTGLLIEPGNPWTPEQAGKLTKTTVAGGGPTYGLFLMQLSHVVAAAEKKATLAELKTHIESITVKIVRLIPMGGGQVREETIKPIDAMSATELLNFYAYHGFPLIDGYFPIYFMQPNFLGRMSGKVARHFDLGTADVKEIHVEVKLSATVDTPVMTLYKAIRNVQPKPMGQLIGWQRSTFAAVAAAGTVPIDNLNVKDGSTIRALHLDTDKVSEIRLKVNGTLRHTVKPGMQDYLLEILTAETGGKNPQAGWTHIDFTGNDYGAQWDLSKVTRFDIDLDVTEAIGQYAVWMEKVMGPRVAPGSW